MITQEQYLTYIGELAKLKKGKLKYTITGTILILFGIIVCIIGGVLCATTNPGFASLITLGVLFIIISIVLYITGAAIYNTRIRNRKRAIQNYNTQNVKQ